MVIPFLHYDVNIGRDVEIKSSVQMRGAVRGGDACLSVVLFDNSSFE